MKKILRRESNAPRARQRHPQEDESVAKAPEFSYRALRLEGEANTGRRVDRQDRKLPVLRSGRFWLQRSGLIVLLIAIVISVANVLQLSTTAQIMPVDTSEADSPLFDKTAYQAEADQVLAESIWNRNKITVDTGKVSQRLLAQFPDLTSVSVTIPLLTHHPIIYIEPAQPVLVMQSATSGSFILDATGKAVLQNSTTTQIKDSAALPVVTDLSGLPLALGRDVLPATSVSFIQTVVAQLAAKHYMVASMTLPPAASELDVKLAGQAYIIKFNLENNDPRQQVGTFLATITELESQHITPAQYIDVRVDGRAFYQ